MAAFYDMNTPGHKTIQSLVEKVGFEYNTKAFAMKMDEEDELKSFRNEFHFPPGIDDKPSIYLCGNSLGIQPKNTVPYVTEELEKWQKYGVEGHFPGVNPVRPWVTADEHCRDDMAAIVGAKPVEVAIMNSLTVNLHVLMCAFYNPTPTRYKILMEGKAFPSDKFALQSQSLHYRSRVQGPGSTN